MKMKVVNRQMNDTKKELNYLDFYLKFVDENNFETISFIDGCVLDNEPNKELSFKNIDKSVLSSYDS